MALITITSSFGSGGENVAVKVSEQLGTLLFDDGKIQEKALSIGISEKDFCEFDEKAPGLFDRLFTNNPSIYLDLLGSVVYDIASGGEGVIMGHAAQVFLKDFSCAFHVRIHAPEESRSQWIAKEKGMSESESLELIRKMDKRFKDFVSYGFNRDWNDLAGYDLVVNLDKIDIERAVTLISDLSESEKVRECGLNSLEKMEFSSLKLKVDAAIIKNGLTSPLGFFYTDVTGKGKVRLWGSARNSEEHEKLLTVVKNVPGVTEVQSDIFIMPQRY